MSKPVQELLRPVHVEQIDIQRLKHEDFEVLECLKESGADLFKSLKKVRTRSSEVRKIRLKPANCPGTDYANSMQEDVTMPPKLWRFLASV
jgi:hypothetical protein